MIGHEGYNLMIGISLDEWRHVIVFGTSFVEIPKISTNMHYALFFHDRYRVRNPRHVRNRIDEPNFVEFIYFLFDFFCLRRM